MKNNKPKVLLVGINAKYIHSNLAIRYLKNYIQENSTNDNIHTVEYSINNRADEIIQAVFGENPDIIGFSTYIWNVELVLKITATIKLILPNCTIFLGGPEVSYETENFLKSHKEVDFLIKGEGEIPLTEFLNSVTNKTDLSLVTGISYIDKGGNFINNPPAEYLDMNKLAFPYEDKDFTNLEHKIIYYEASRGCPYNCQYCMSSLDKKVRCTDLEKTKKELLIFLNFGVRQVKFVDRTFNFNKTRSLELWEFLIENDNGITNFHFEIAAILLDDEILEKIKHARNGLFQFEIGVQTTNQKTADAIIRPTDFVKISSVVKKINTYKNIHQHLDLIIGLPFEDYSSFKNSFNDVYALSPQQFQLGFLKLLKGSGLYADREKYNLIHQPTPPYEILSTNELSYKEILFLKIIEDIVDRFHNSERFSNTLSYLKQNFTTPFDFFETLAEYYKTHGYQENLSKDNHYKMLFDFGLLKGYSKPILSDCIRLDMMSYEKSNKGLHWLETSNFETYKQQIRVFLEDNEKMSKVSEEFTSVPVKERLKKFHIEVLNSPVIDENYSNIHTAYLFDYREPKNIKYYQITL